MLLALCFLLTGAAAAQSPSVDNSADLRAGQFSSTQLNGLQMKGFHERAQQKVRDFAELVGLLSDQQLEKEIRQAAFEAALKMFAQPEAVVHWYDFEKKAVVQLPIKQLLKRLQEGSQKVEAAVAGFEGVPPPGCQAPGCTWSLRFRLTEKDGAQHAVTMDAVLEIVLKQTTKTFGTQKKEVWEVFLGESKELRPRP